MPRASNGVYSLPAGNPVVTGTTIASTWANTTMSDVATAMTDSLDRSGFGGMLAALQLFAGTAGSPGLSWAVETNSGLYRNASGDFRYSIAATDILLISAGKFVVQSTPTIQSVLGTYASGGYAGTVTNQLFELRTNNAARLSIAAGGTVTLNAPASAAYSLLITAGNTVNSCVAISGTAGVNASMEFAGNGTVVGTTSLFVGQGADSQAYVYQRANSTLNLATNANIRITLSAAGNVTINTPASGKSLTTGGVVPGALADRIASFDVTGGDSRLAVTTTTSGNPQVNFDIFGVQNWACGGRRSDGALVFSSAQDLSTPRVVVASGGNVTISAPSSGTGVVISGAASAYGLQVIGSSSSTHSFGLSVHAGTTSADTAFDVTNQAGATDYFTVRGDGLVQAIDQGGTLQDVGWRDTPNIVSGSITFALADRGKSYVPNANNVVFTIPANASVAMPVGSVITISTGSSTGTTVAINTDTLIWAGIGSTGTRSLSANALVTMFKHNANTWYISGAGIS